MFAVPFCCAAPMRPAAAGGAADAAISPATAAVATVSVPGPAAVQTEMDALKADLSEVKAKLSDVEEELRGVNAKLKKDPGNARLEEEKARLLGKEARLQEKENLLLEKEKGLAGQGVCRPPFANLLVLRSFLPLLLPPSMRVLRALAVRCGCWLCSGLLARCVCRHSM